MRLSYLSGKEVINLSDGSRLGVIDDCELTFDTTTGCIHKIILPNRNGLFSFFSENPTAAIPWKSIRRIGDEVIIVDMHNAYEEYKNMRRSSSYST